MDFISRNSNTVSPSLPAGGNCGNADGCSGGAAFHLCCPVVCGDACSEMTDPGVLRTPYSIDNVIINKIKETILLQYSRLQPAYLLHVSCQRAVVVVLYFNLISSKVGRRTNAKTHHVHYALTAPDWNIVSCLPLHINYNNA